MNGTCETCGNGYDKTIEILAADGSRHQFDCFECAIQALAPVCSGCGCRIVGHGLESGSSTFCSAHCARNKGVARFVDRA